MFLNAISLLSGSASAMVRMQLVIPSAYFSASPIAAISTSMICTCGGTIGSGLLRAAEFPLVPVATGLEILFALQKGGQFGEVQMLALVALDVFEAINDMTAPAQFQERRSLPQPAPTFQRARAHPPTGG